MITADLIRPLRSAIDDDKQTGDLKAKLGQLRQERQPFYLTEPEFDQILKWKLRQQYGRQKALRKANSDELIRSVTGLALNITHENREYELELRVDILCALRGVGVPVASAVLALAFPDEYAVIDFRGWRQVFGGSNQTTFSTSDYKRYMREIRRLAAELSWPVQEVDMAIWEYDRRQSGDSEEQATEEKRQGSLDGDTSEAANMTRKRLKTWAGKNEFEYAGSVAAGTDI
jgi:hypothetical protein